VAHYLLSVHSDSSQPRQPMSDEDMQAFMARVNALEEDMRSQGAYVFGGALQGPDGASVVAVKGDAPLITDGPYVETKEHIAGIYLVEADDLDAAMGWAAKVTEAVGKPIEVRAFQYSALA
jgi:hypothetical protein